MQFGLSEPHLLRAHKATITVRLLDAAHGVRLNTGDGAVKVFAIQKSFFFFFMPDETIPSDYR